MGTHGRTGLLRLLMGSVAEAVVRRTTVPRINLEAARECGSGNRGQLRRLVLRLGCIIVWPIGRGRRVEFGVASPCLSTIHCLEHQRFVSQQQFMRIGGTFLRKSNDR